MERNNSNNSHVNQIAGICVLEKLLFTLKPIFSFAYESRFIARPPKYGVAIRFGSILKIILMTTHW